MSLSICVVVVVLNTHKEFRKIKSTSPFTLRKIGKGWKLGAILAPIDRTAADFFHENRIQSVNKHARLVE